MFQHMPAALFQVITTAGQSHSTGSLHTTLMLFRGVPVLSVAHYCLMPCIARQPLHGSTTAHAPTSSGALRQLHRLDEAWARSWIRTFTRVRVSAGHPTRRGSFCSSRDASWNNAGRRTSALIT
jgi:hypothetical protein